MEKEGCKVKKELVEQTNYWLKKLENLKIEAKSKDGDEIKRNAQAYISDAHYFLEKEDYVRAFEAVIWAWAWVEIGEKLDILDVSPSQ